jgi:hypothetical protein
MMIEKISIGIDFMKDVISIIIFDNKKSGIIQQLEVLQNHQSLLKHGDFKDNNKVAYITPKELETISSIDFDISHIQYFSEINIKIVASHETYSKNATIKLLEKIVKNVNENQFQQQIEPVNHIENKEIEGKKENKRILKIKRKANLLDYLNGEMN